MTQTDRGTGMVLTRSHILDWGKALTDQKKIFLLYFQLALDQCSKVSKCQHWVVVKSTAASNEAQWNKLLHCMLSVVHRDLVGQLSINRKHVWHSWQIEFTCHNLTTMIVITIVMKYRYPGNHLAEHTAVLELIWTLNIIIIVRWIGADQRHYTVKDLVPITVT